MKRMVWIAIAAGVAMLIVIIANSQVQKINEINSQNASQNTFISPDIDVDVETKETSIWDYIDGITTTIAEETTVADESISSESSDENSESGNAESETAVESTTSLIDKINGNKTKETESSDNPVVVIN